MSTDPAIAALAYGRYAVADQNVNPVNLGFGVPGTEIWCGGVKRVFLRCHLYVKMHHFYQDRLGTNIAGKTQKRTTRSCRFGVHLWDWAERKEKKTHDTNTSNDDVDNNDERVEGGGGNMTGKAFLGAFTGKKTALFEPFIYKNQHFAKTGSGQT
eukprot:COSAG06_NODE_71_length_25945_cov_9.124468_34_plen_155_part_00